MTEVKAVDIVATRKILLERNRETVLLPRLSATARVVFQTALAIAWVDAGVEEEILTQGASVLFPDDPHPLKQLGRMISSENLCGIYKAFIRIPSPAFIIKRTSWLWALMSKKGKASAEMTGPGSAILTLVRYPDLAVYQLDYISGWLEGLLVTMGYAKVCVTCLADNPDAWRWNVSWE